MYSSNESSALSEFDPLGGTDKERDSSSLIDWSTTASPSPSRTSLGPLSGVVFLSSQDIFQGQVFRRRSTFCVSLFR